MKINYVPDVLFIVQRISDITIGAISYFCSCAQYFMILHSHASVIYRLLYDNIDIVYC